MITTEHFRVRIRATGEWVIGSGEFGELTSPKRSEGLVFEPDQREHWKDHQEFEIAPLTEAEIMAQLPPEIAPRLPGFEW
jgi:hypothetical protein